MSRSVRSLVVTALAAGVASIAALPVASATAVSEQSLAVQSEEAPPRVTGFSNFFDYMATGATLVVPLAYGLGTSTVNVGLSQLPAEAQPLTQQILLAEAAGPQLFAAMAEPTTQFIDAGRQAVAPLAAYNEQFNGGIDGLSGGARALGSAMAPIIQPADVSVAQFAAFLDGLKQN